MNQEIIIYNECSNEGKRIFLYYNENIGAMEAYGYSAFLVSRVLFRPLSLFSEDLQMPCVVLAKEQVETLKSQCSVDEYFDREDYLVLHLANPVPYDNSGYDHFVEQLREMNTEKSSEETEKKASWFSKLIGFFDR